MIQQATQNIPADANPGEAEATPTLWGLEPTQLHDRFWAARGVQVVRIGTDEPLSTEADFYLLADPNAMVLFGLGSLLDTMGWLKPRLVFIRLHDARDHGYRERVVTKPDGSFIAFRRLYDSADLRLSRMALTPHREVAERWRDAADARDAWRYLRGQVSRKERTTVSIEGRMYSRREPAEQMQCLRDIVQIWERPDTALGRLRKWSGQVWADLSTVPPGDTRFIGPVWVGAGRTFNGARSVVGPAVVWDDPEKRPTPPPVRWSTAGEDVERDPFANLGTEEELANRRPRRISWRLRAAKRVIDISGALFGLTLTLPFYPLIMAAIWVEDRSPFFFAHQRETMGEVNFPCLKFRTMRRDAEGMKEQLAAKNVSDGPQFFIPDDPRITRVGHFLRKTNLDELPQLFNVLVGHMSLVGPRPSPHKENQYAPGWREARLSVRPGITGLWQVKRSREAGKDFQEWIRYDIEYVEKMSIGLDLWIIWKTLVGRGG